MEWEVWFNQKYNCMALTRERNDGLLKLILDDKSWGVLHPDEMTEFGYVYLGKI